MVSHLFNTWLDIQSSRASSPCTSSSRPSNSSPTRKCTGGFDATAPSMTAATTTENEPFPKASMTPWTRCCSMKKAGEVEVPNSARTKEWSYYISPSATHHPSLLSLNSSLDLEWRKQSRLWLHSLSSICFSSGHPGLLLRRDPLHETDLLRPNELLVQEKVWPRDEAGEENLFQCRSKWHQGI